MFKTIVVCPNCRNDIALEDARTEIPLPEQSTKYKKIQLVYTICPRCKRDFRVRGEKRAAIMLLLTFLAVLSVGFVVDSWWPLVAAGSVLVVQKKFVQLLVQTEHA